MNSPRHVTAAEAASLIRPIDSIGMGLGPAIPHAFMKALGERQDWEDLQLGGALLLDVYDVLTHGPQYPLGGSEEAAPEVHPGPGHDVQLVVGGFRQFAPILAAQAPRVMVVQGAPSAEGGINLSLHLGATYDALVAAGRDPERMLVAEINPNLPATRSLPPAYSNEIGPGLIDAMVSADHQPFELPEEPPTDVDREIAGLARRYIREDSTLQTGIGAVPNMVASLLADSPGGGYGTGSTARCSPMACAGCTRPARSPTLPRASSKGAR